MNRVIRTLVVLSPLFAALAYHEWQAQAAIAAYRVPLPAVCGPCVSAPWQKCCGGSGSPEVPPYVVGPSGTR